MLAMVGGCFDAGRGYEPELEPSMYSARQLRIDADRSNVLVTINGEAAVTVGFFNDLILEFAVEDRDQEPFDARMEVLSKMIDFQVILIEARRLHPEGVSMASANAMVDTRQLAVGQSEEGSTSSDADAQSAAPSDPYAEERALARAVIQERVIAPDAVSDQDVKAYFEQHSAELDELVGPDSSVKDKMFMARIALIDTNWRKQVEEWRSQEEITVFEEHLKDRAAS
jgi:hypothetical protein